MFTRINISPELLPALFGMLIICSHLIVNEATAQDIRVNLYSAYAFDDHFNSYYDNGRYYDGKLKGSNQWGVGFEYALRSDYGIEILYLRQDTHSPTTYATGPLQVEHTDFDIALNYIMIGGVRRVHSANQKLEGFGGLMAGVVVAELENPDTHRQSNATKFSWGIRAGGVIWASDLIGIKLQAQLLSAVQSMGGGLYFGSGGSVVGLTSYSTLYQLSLGGGLVIKIRKKQ